MPWLSQQGHVRCTPEGQLLIQCKQMWWVQACCDQLHAEFSCEDLASTKSSGCIQVDKKKKNVNGPVCTGALFIMLNDALGVSYLSLFKYRKQLRR